MLSRPIFTLLLLPVFSLHLSPLSVLITYDTHCLHCYIQHNLPHFQLSAVAIVYKIGSSCPSRPLTLLGYRLTWERRPREAQLNGARPLTVARYSLTRKTNTHRKKNECFCSFRIGTAPAFLSYSLSFYRSLSRYQIDACVRKQCLCSLCSHLCGFICLMLVKVCRKAFIKMSVLHRPTLFLMSICRLLCCVTLVFTLTFVLTQFCPQITKETPVKSVKVTVESILARH